MNLRPLMAVGLTAGALALNVSAIAAPVYGGSSAPASIPQGPPIPGYCVMSINAIIGGSRVGQAYVARMKVLESQAKAELQPDADSIRAEQQRLQSQSSVDAAARSSFQQRVSSFEKLGQLRQQEMQATQQKQVGVIMQELKPVLRELYVQHRCSILVDADQGGVNFVNPEMDLSRQAVTGLDARIQTLNFDREHLDAGAASTGAR